MGNGTILAFIPLILMFVLYLAIIMFGIWFTTTLIRTQRERNEILSKIASKMDTYETTKKSDTNF
ncbi:hypothetical protein [Paenisporosarcina cavernae]|uniref:DUF4083 domain-containing protein n=1 Tax=Paenisporosarcina cavernae TaxID=2320858 RepID=A0A385YTX1_9BACL|nr:hypothetical protein [Paenisporosarcina cavernae]AYC30325.1 hypothetical protein D3873_10875 [Paenisporosarcina cavernae]